MHKLKIEDWIGFGEIIFMIYRLLCIFINTDTFKDEIDFYAQVFDGDYYMSLPHYFNSTKKRAKKIYFAALANNR